MSLTNLIKKFNRNKRILFTTPSHNQGAFIVPECKKLLGKKYFKSDYSEIEDFDNLSFPQGVILESQKKAAEIYESKASFFLPNGSTSGMIAAMLSVLSSEDTVLVSRNCHRSVYNGFVLTGANPIWILPKMNEEWNIHKPIKVEDIELSIELNQTAKALILTNPTYEGAIADITKISNLCKEKGIILVVDEAHGALWNFDKTIGIPSILQGADVTVQSLHKTAGAVNPSAIMHVSQDSLVEPSNIQNSLNLVNTTSPSYPILANIESTIDFLTSNKGKKEISKLVDSITAFKSELKEYKNIHVLFENNDITKILIKIDNLSGFELSDMLFSKYKIEDEMANEKSVLFLTGIGTTKAKLNCLKKALIKIAQNPYSKANTDEEELQVEFKLPKPQVVFTPRQAYEKQSVEVEINDCEGEICAELIYNYPPGIPLLIPGEIIQQSHIQFLQNHEKIRVILK